MVYIPLALVCEMLVDGQLAGLKAHEGLVTVVSTVGGTRYVASRAAEATGEIVDRLISLGP